jgi:hypothetical protein
MANKTLKRRTIFMNIRNEIKAYIVREGFTMSELVEKLAEQYDWSPSPQPLRQAAPGIPALQGGCGAG